jgi:hypothetical protein
VPDRVNAEPLGCHDFPFTAGAGHVSQFSQHHARRQSSPDTHHRMSSTGSATIGQCCSCIKDDIGLPIALCFKRNRISHHPK